MNIVTANRLMELRKKHGYSQEQLAEKLGLTRQAISKWERAEASPDTDNLIALARLYGVSLDDLLNEEEVGEEDIAPEVKEETPAHGEEEEDDEDKDPLIGIVNAVTLFTSIIAFVLVGLLVDGGWGWSWTILMLIPLVPSLMSAIRKRDANHFAYPILVTAVYCLLGILGGYWHPYWVMFLTIPLYYALVNGIKLLVNRKKA